MAITAIVGAGRRTISTEACHFGPKRTKTKSSAKSAQAIVIGKVRPRRMRRTSENSFAGDQDRPAGGIARERHLADCRIHIVGRNAGDLKASSVDADGVTPRNRPTITLSALRAM